MIELVPTDVYDNLLSNLFKSMVYRKPLYWDQSHKITIFDFVSPYNLEFGGWTCDFM